jgi:hypothetical protein
MRDTHPERMNVFPWLRIAIMNLSQIFRNPEKFLREDDMTIPAHTRPNWITLIIWLVGLLLQFARPWLCNVFALNTEIFMFSIMGPFVGIFTGVPAVWCAACISRTII